MVVDHSQDWFFLLVAPPLQPGVVELFPSMRCMVPQPFTAGRNRSYPEFWAITSGLRNPGYLPRQVPIRDLWYNSTKCWGV
jgi:hypothetical protein